MAMRAIAVKLIPAARPTGSFAGVKLSKPTPMAEIRTANSSHDYTPSSVGAITERGKTGVVDLQDRSARWQSRPWARHGQGRLSASTPGP
jgi:hypothetical protein